MEMNIQSMLNKDIDENVRIWEDAHVNVGNQDAITVTIYRKGVD